MQTGYVIMITAVDGTISVCGPYADPKRADRDAALIREAGLGAQRVPLERPASVLAGLRDL